jgi:hypothetical protein
VDSLINCDLDSNALVPRASQGWQLGSMNQPVKWMTRQDRTHERLGYSHCKILFHCFQKYRVIKNVLKV